MGYSINDSPSRESDFNAAHTARQAAAADAKGRDRVAQRIHDEGKAAAAAHSLMQR